MAFQGGILAILLGVACTTDEFIALPEGPELVTPEHQAIVTQNTLSVVWQGVDGARAYDIVLGLDNQSPLDTILVEGRPTGEFSQSVTLPYSTFPDGWQFLQVDAVAQLMRYPSLIHSILVTLPATTSTQPGPNGSICVSDQQFSWDAIADATAYRVDIFEPGNPEPVRSLEVSNTSLTLEGETALTPGEYLWEVRGIAENGETGIPLSHTLVIFSELSPPDGLVSPPDQFGSLTGGILRWNGVPAAEAYDVELYSGACGTGGTLIWSGSAAGGTQELTLPITLNPTDITTYHWRIRVAQVEPCPENPWSGCSTFTLTPCLDPQATAATAEDICPGGNSTVTWTPRPAFTYEAELSLDSGMTWQPATSIDSEAGEATFEAPFGGNLVTLTTTKTESPLRNILSNATLQSGLVFPTSCAIEDLNVRINSLTHDDTSDLILVLEHNGKSATLSRNNGAGGQSYTNTLFDDEATQSISGALAPFTGSFRPRNPLSVFTNEDAQGLWILNITDVSPGGTGAFGTWSIDVSCRVIGASPPASWRIREVNFCGDSMDGPEVSFGTRSTTVPTVNITTTVDGASCNIDSGVEFLFEAGTTYDVEFFNIVTRVWEDIDEAMDCMLNGSNYVCDRGAVQPGTGSGYQWRVSGTTADGCRWGPVYSDTFASQFAPSDWDGTGFFIKSDDLSGCTPQGGINNTWEIEAICPDVWDSPGNNQAGWTVGTVLDSSDLFYCSSCGTAGPAPIPVPGVNCGVGGTQQSWFTATKAFFLTVPSVTLQLSVDPSAGDAVHLDLFDQSISVPPPGPPGDTGAVRSRQFCVASDAFGCGTTDTSPFTLSAGCYLLRVTVVDSTAGTCVTFDADLSAP